MPFPASGMTNMKKYIELDGEVYCTLFVRKLEKKTSTIQQKFNIFLFILTNGKYFLKFSLGGSI